jgi:hypothetical protein
MRLRQQYETVGIPAALYADVVAQVVGHALRNRDDVLAFVQFAVALTAPQGLCGRQGRRSGSIIFKFFIKSWEFRLGDEGWRTNRMNMVIRWLDNVRGEGGYAPAKQLSR